jgi:hypothetical protein
MKKIVMVLGLTFAGCTSGTGPVNESSDTADIDVPEGGQACHEECWSDDDCAALCNHCSASWLQKGICMEGEVLAPGPQ